MYGDFALVICQLNGEWETRNSKLVPYQEFIKGLIEQFEEITFKHLPREENYLADALATLATMFKVMLKPSWSSLKSENHKLIVLASNESQMETLGTTTF